MDNSNLPAVPQKWVMPSLEDLQKSPEEAFERSSLNFLLNQPIPKSWVQKHPFLKMKNDKGEEVPLEYLPIDKVEFMLTRIFGVWKREIISYGPLFNSVSVHVRLSVKDPLTGGWLSHDGVGAVDVQTKKGASAADLAQIVPGAIQKGLPAATSFALKDAAECFGSLFGSNLSRRFTLEFKPETVTRWNAHLKQKADGQQSANAGQ